MAKLIVGSRRSGKTTHLLDWLWERRSHKVALFVPDTQRRIYLKKSIKGNLNVLGPSWGRKWGEQFDYSGIDDLWLFNNPRDMLIKVSEATSTEVRCTIDDSIFDVVKIEDLRGDYNDERAYR